MNTCASARGVGSQDFVLDARATGRAGSDLTLSGEANMILAPLLSQPGNRINRRKIASKSKRSVLLYGAMRTGRRLGATETCEKMWQQAARIDAFCGRPFVERYSA